MSYPSLLLSLVVASAAPQAPAGEAKGKCKVLVLNVAGDDKLKDLRGVLTQELTTEIGAVTKCEVVSQAELAAMLDVTAQQKECGVESDACLAEIGAALGAERLVSSSLAAIDGTYTLGARLVNVKKAVVEARGEESDARSDKMRFAARRLGGALFGVAVEEDRTLLWVGGGLATAGAIAGAAGGAYAALVDGRLADPTEHDKGSLHAQGIAAVGLAALGVVTLASGATLVMAEW